LIDFAAVLLESSWSLKVALSFGTIWGRLVITLHEEAVQWSITFLVVSIIALRGLLSLITYLDGIDDLLHEFILLYGGR
jgi:hypothetical protein